MISLPSHEPVRLPPALCQLLAGAAFAEETIGCSTSAVFRVSGVPGYGSAYLKTQQLQGGDDLRPEADLLRWLQGKLPVPQVIYFEQDAGWQYLLISEIPGSRSCDQPNLKASVAPDTVRALARGLRQIHSLDISACPFRRTLDIALAEAAHRVEAGLVDTDNMQPENIGRDPKDILQQLLRTRPAEDLVFTHGDYCLPNIMLLDGEVSGFIDWGRGGVADRYVDLALALRSLRHNLGLAAGEQLGRVFLQEYGLKSADEQKIAYYILLDELF